MNNTTLFQHGKILFLRQTENREPIRVLQFELSFKDRCSKFSIFPYQNLWRLNVIQKSVGGENLCTVHVFIKYMDVDATSLVGLGNLDDWLFFLASHRLENMQCARIMKNGVDWHQLQIV
jgi:hypothetical protein